MSRTIKTFAIALSFFLAITLWAQAQSQAQGNLRVGAAKVDITPTKEMLPVPGLQTLAGVHDPLFARALVIDNGSTKMTLIGVDTASLSNGADVLKAVSMELGIPTNQLSIAATHAHNTPTFGGGQQATGYDRRPYQALLLKGIVEAARQANAKLQPARIGFGTGKAYINTNRDQKIGDSYKMGYAPEGVSDKTVAVMLATTLAGDPIAVWSNYAVHGVVMFLSKTTPDGKSEVTGDIGGATSNYVEERLGHNAVAVWTQGASGDQNPFFMSTYNQDAPDVHDQGAAGWAILDVQARRLGEEIVRVARNIGNTKSSAVLWSAASTVTCPGRKRDASAPAPVVSGSFTPGADTAPMVDAEPVNIAINLMMINDLALANVSGEVFTEISLKLKKASLFDRTAMVTLVASMEGSAGYIPSEAAYLLPSAMAARNRIKPGCAESAIVDEFLGLQQKYLSIWKTVQ